MNRVFYVGIWQRTFFQPQLILVMVKYNLPIHKEHLPLFHFIIMGIFIGVI